jgi:hypothetical protein
MSDETKQITYFDRSGPVNTDKALQLAKERALALGIRQLVIPSRTGDSAWRARDIFDGTDLEIVCVSSPQDTHLLLSLLEKWGTFDEIPELSALIQSWRNQSLQRIPHAIPIEESQRLQAAGIQVVYGRSAWMKPPYSSKIEYPGIKTLGQAILLAIRLLCTGVEVAVKSTMIAVEAGAIATAQEVIAFGGVERGLDTAIVLRPAEPGKLFDEKEGMDIREIICKPRTGLGLSGKLLERISPI